MGIELCHSDKFQIQEVGIFLLGYSAHHNISALSFLKDTVRQHETMCGKICGKVCSVSFPPVPLNLYLSTSIRHPVKTGYESERQDHTQGIARAPEYPALRRARNLQTSHDSSKKIVIEKPSMRTAFIRMEGDPAPIPLPEAWAALPRPDDGGGGSARSVSSRSFRPRSQDPLVFLSGAACPP